ncbi:FAD dependent oxidoreductase [Biscogniauxia marginata]|nr:FAD dependent oxidoreductase [Biscogniauxia marginata]
MRLNLFAATKRQCVSLLIPSCNAGGQQLCPARRSFSSTAPARADFTHIVIGAGVIGLATARALALARPESSTLLLERHAQPGTETSSRNSEVIHGGLYYGAGTLKTRLCVAGKEALYAFCARHGVGHARTGKWIVAQDDDAERAALDALHAFCRDEVGVPTRLVGSEEARRREPDVRAAAVLESPTTGIVDSHGLMVALRGHFEEAGGTTALRARVVGVEALRGSSGVPGSAGWSVSVRSGDGDDNNGGATTTTGETSRVTAETIINSAGLGAADVHNMIAPAGRQAKLYYAKGNYFSYAASRPRVSRLVYPVTPPGAGGLGTHLTLDLAGRARFGPDVEWVDSPDDLDVSGAAGGRLPRALAEIRRYLPGVDGAALAPDYAGVRPKLAPAGAVGAGKGFVDFYVRREDGFEGWVSMLGMESPGLTSCLAIGDYVVDLLYGSQSRSPG